MYQTPTGGFLNILKNINLTNILDGTSKTLNVINQAIPVYNQVKPLVNNIGTIFKISNIMKEDNIKEKDQTSNTSPIFYL